MAAVLPQDYSTVDVWEHGARGGLWTPRRGQHVSVLNGTFDKPITVIFAQTNTKNAEGEDKKKGEEDEKDRCLNRRFLSPGHFKPVLQDDINGSFFCDYKYSNEDVDDNEDDDNDDNNNNNHNGDKPKPTNHISWATYKAKWVETEQHYHWIQITLRIDWDIRNKRLLILFMDVPKAQQDYIQENLPTKRKQQFHPFEWHALFAESVIDLYNTTIWKLRDVVRAIEKERTIITQTAKKLSRQHDTARHIYHCTEILEVAENTLVNLVDEHKRYQEGCPRMTRFEVLVNTQQKLYFLLKEMHSHRMRCKSLVERINNEMSFGFNITAISEGSVMRKIGIVSMIYLPGTFVSGIFGTNFFDFNAPSEATWTTSDRFWLYWAVTLPLTAMTIAIWMVWHTLPKWFPKVIKVRSEMQHQKRLRKTASREEKKKQETGDDRKQRGGREMGDDNV